MTEWLPVHINDQVRVKLTDIGYKHYREKIKRENKRLRINTPTTPKIDEDGWYYSQLWSLMQDFGGAFMMGSAPPFSLDIEVAKE